MASDTPNTTVLGRFRRMVMAYRSARRGQAALINGEALWPWQAAWWAIRVKTDWPK